VHRVLYRSPTSLTALPEQCRVGTVILGKRMSDAEQKDHELELERESGAKMYHYLKLLKKVRAR
jgi:hypothetical protein